MHTIGNKFLGGFVNGYKITTLENNVDEDRFDQKYLKEHKPIASDFSGYYETTYDEAAKAVTESNELGKQHIFTKVYRLPAFPGHQPEYDLVPQHSYKTTYNELNKQAWNKKE